jgi:cardiolipin synthase A/B
MPSIPSRGKYRFPWRPHNRVVLLVDGERFFPRMLERIARARLYILLEMYLFESGTQANDFIDALVDAAGRGVRVQLLLDDFGARGLSHFDRSRLQENGVNLEFYNPFYLGKLTDNLARDHRKLLLVDGGIAFTGGAGITDEFNPQAFGRRRWRETMVEIQGPVVSDWQTLFEETWYRHAAESLDLPQPVVSPDIAGGMQGRVTLARGLASQEIQRSMIQRIRGAEHRAWIATAYFVPSWRLRRSLRRAAGLGVDVRLLLPGPRTDHPGVRYAGRRFYARLLRHGVRIFEYQPRVLHAKVSLCDHWVSIGSSNFDRWNLRWNLEANQEIDDQSFAESVRAMFAVDFAESVEYRDEDWHHRPWFMRLAERLWGRVDLWLNSLGKGRRE